MKEFVGLRAKTCSCLKDNNDKDKKAKAQKCVSSKGNFYMKIIKTLYKHLKLKVKYKRLKNKIKLMYILLRSKRIHKK